MVDPVELRSRFKGFAGVEKYRRFIKAIHNTWNQDCLRYWQQKLWDSFVALNADCLLSVSELRDRLNICELHETELVPVEVPVIRVCGIPNYVSEYIYERSSSFPHASVNNAIVNETYEGTTCTIWVCIDCDVIKSKSRWRRI